jgi:quercetin dioxygenase-like cupin family protein
VATEKLSSESAGRNVADLMEFDLAQEMAEAEKKKPWAMGRFAQTLVKRPDMRVVLISIEKGAELKEHHADGSISVQVLRGAVRFAAGAEARILKAGQAVSLGASIKHEVQALEDAAFLLTISWPEAQRLEAMPHRGYGK